jgi:GTPase SAR1 family protein
VLLVYDVTDRVTFSDLKVWMAAIREHAAENIKMVLVANKVDDLEAREVTRFEGQNTARENGMMYFEVSAKENQGIKDCVDFTIKEVYDDIIKRMSISPLDKTRDPSMPLDPSRHSSVSSRKPKRRCACLRFFQSTDTSQ